MSSKDRNDEIRKLWNWRLDSRTIASKFGVSQASKNEEC